MSNVNAHEWRVPAIFQRDMTSFPRFTFTRWWVSLRYLVERVKIEATKAVAM